MRWFGWFRNPPKPPGVCQCSHKQCEHVGGSSYCFLRGCPCMIYLEVVNPEVVELEKLYRR
jgi:hypothetical protein